MCVKTISYQDILDFWYAKEVSTYWFAATADIDNQIKHKFEHVVQSALQNEYIKWQDNAWGMLANIIVLDQFPLHIYRHTKQSFAGEQQAVALSRRAIALHFDKVLTTNELIFLFMPLMHSENINHQHLAVQMYEKYDMQDNLAFAKHHRDIIKRFGRFPHRNTILGRVNTPLETQYLASKDAFLG